MSWLRYFPTKGVHPFGSGPGCRRLGALLQPIPVLLLAGDSDGGGPSMASKAGLALVSAPPGLRLPVTPPGLTKGLPQ